MHIPKMKKGSLSNWVEDIKIDGWKKNNTVIAETILLLKINLDDLYINMIEEDQTNPLIISNNIGASYPVAQYTKAIHLTCWWRTYDDHQSSHWELCKKVVELIASWWYRVESIAKYQKPWPLCKCDKYSLLTITNNIMGWNWHSATCRN